MARRKARQTKSPSLLLIGLAFIFCIPLVIFLMQHLQAIVSLLALLLATVLAIKIMRKQNRANHTKRLHETMRARVSAVIEDQLPQLAKRRAQLVRPDPYGKLLFDSWSKEMAYFIDQHIIPALSAEERLIFVTERERTVQWVSKRTSESLEINPAFRDFSQDMSPSEFEMYCAEKLREAGWNAQVTRGSRDQGVDVIAEKASLRVVLQCKLYSSPVGNSAVQEIAAGRAHERAHFGAVVTNNRFTLPAEQLASTNSILLLHYTELAGLERLIGLQHAA